MMTWEEAIKVLNNFPIDFRNSGGFEAMEALKIAILALRPVSREQVEKVWKGEWIGMTDDDGCTWYECSQCEHDLDSLEVPNHFCPACGAPMTDEAVETIMKRMEEMRND